MPKHILKIISNISQSIQFGKYLLSSKTSYCSLKDNTFAHEEETEINMTEYNLT